MPTRVDLFVGRALRDPSKHLVVVEKAGYTKITRAIRHRTMRLK
jgi:hypothetical protein